MFKIKHLEYDEMFYSKGYKTQKYILNCISINIHVYVIDQDVKRNVCSKA